MTNIADKKAACPDRIKPVVLQELREELAPIVKVLKFFLNAHKFESGAVPLIWNSANVSTIFKKGEKSAAANYDPSPLHASCDSLWNTS